MATLEDLRLQLNALDTELQLALAKAEARLLALKLGIPLRGTEVIHHPQTGLDFNLSFERRAGAPSDGWRFCLVPAGGGAPRWDSKNLPRELRVKIPKALAELVDNLSGQLLERVRQRREALALVQELTQQLTVLAQDGRVVHDRCGVCAGPVTADDPIEETGDGTTPGHLERTCASCRAKEAWHKS